MYAPSVHAIVHVHAQTHVISIQLQNGGVFPLDLETGHMVYHVIYSSNVCSLQIIEYREMVTMGRKG